MKIILPEKVRYIIASLEAAGYEAYAVGGCVRDSILGKSPNDWDICTSALPEEAEKVFCNERIIESGIKHGTITLILEHIPFEITTFRTENGYSDSRRPDSVNFVKSITEDLGRRDFTVNAMAYNISLGLVDKFGGCEDLENKCIRCVGNPDERFSEDALRIMRAIRFAAVLGFDIDKKTAKAVRDKKFLLKNIATERINTEFTKALLSDNPQLLYKYKEVISEFLECAKNLDAVTVKAISLLPHNRCLRLAALLLGIYRSDSDLTDKIKTALINMKYDKKTIKRVSDIAACSTYGVPATLKECRLLAGNFGLDIIYDRAIIGSVYAAALNNTYEAELFSNAIGYIDEIKEKNLCCNISGLDINGEVLKAAGITDGAEIGQLLKTLTSAVIDGKADNKREALLEYAITIYKEKSQ